MNDKRSMGSWLLAPAYWITETRRREIVFWIIVTFAVLLAFATVFLFAGVEQGQH
jgi:hypothetical protein